jgi:hypothetical protein
MLRQAPGMHLVPLQCSHLHSFPSNQRFHTGSSITVYWFMRSECVLIAAHSLRCMMPTFVPLALRLPYINARVTMVKHAHGRIELTRLSGGDQMWRGMQRRHPADSHHARCMPLFHLNIGPLFTHITKNKGRLLRKIGTPSFFCCIILEQIF